MTTPNLENIKALVAALRSGEYSQCFNKLRVESTKTPGQFSYCAAGVMCDLYEKLSGKSLAQDYYQCQVTSSVEIDNFFFDQRRPSFTVHAGYTTGLVAMNDYHKLSFPQIADIIEEKYRVNHNPNAPAETPNS